MPSPDFEPLVEQLLDLGIAHKYALRLSAELDDHLADLEREALRGDKSALAAAVEAQLRLGRPEAIVAAFADHPELKSWVYRSRLLWHCLYALSWLVLAVANAAFAVLERTAVAMRLALASALTAAVAGLLVLALQSTVSGGRFVASEHGPRHAGRAVAAAAPVHVETRSRLPAGRPTARTRPARPTPPTEPPERTSVAAAYDADLEFRAEPGSGATYFARLAPRVSQPFQVSDGDYLPIVKVAPSFPEFAAARGIEGYVVIEYTVTSMGSVRDVVVVESSSNVFEAPAVEAAYRFKYKPRIIDGRAVPVRGVRTRVSFRLEA